MYQRQKDTPSCGTIVRLLVICVLPFDALLAYRILTNLEPKTVYVPVTAQHATLLRVVAGDQPICDGAVVRLPSGEQLDVQGTLSTWDGEPTRNTTFWRVVMPGETMTVWQDAKGTVYELDFQHFRMIPDC